MTDQELLSHIRVIPDYPIKGIMFQDITTLLIEPSCLKELTDRLYEYYKDKGITKVVGLESRGFVIGAALAYRLGAGFVLARKAGKLPADTICEEYEKEYGTDKLEIHTDAIDKNDVILLHDDLLATGGTIAAAYRLVQKFHPKETYMCFAIDLTDCPKLDVFPKEVSRYSVLEITEGTCESVN